HGTRGGEFQPRPVRQARRSRARRARLARAGALGQARQPPDDALGRHEAAPADRQGARPRAADPVPRRADRGRRRRAAAGNVAGGERAARLGRDHHPHHALHRGGRADGRPHRSDQQGRDHPGGGQGRAHAQARQEARLYVRHAGRAQRDPGAAEGPERRGARAQGLANHAELARGHLCRPGEEGSVNPRGVWAIYAFEMDRTRRTLMQSIAAPVISTALYFVVFGAAIGTRIAQIEGVSYGAFIVPGLVMLTLLTQSISNASFGIYFPSFTGTIYEYLSAPVSS